MVNCHSRFKDAFWALKKCLAAFYDGIWVLNYLAAFTAISGTAFDAVVFIVSDANRDS